MINTLDNNRLQEYFIMNGTRRELKELVEQLAHVPVFIHFEDEETLVIYEDGTYHHYKFNEDGQSYLFSIES